MGVRTAIKKNYLSELLILSLLCAQQAGATSSWLSFCLPFRFHEALRDKATESSGSEQRSTQFLRYNRSPDLSYAHAKPVVQAIKDVNGWLPRSLNPVPSVEIGAFDGPAGRARFDYENWILTVQPTSSRPVILHEYGHGIFVENLSGISAEWKNYIEYTRAKGHFVDAKLKPLQILHERSHERFMYLLTNGNGSAIERVRLRDLEKQKMSDLIDQMTALEEQFDKEHPTVGRPPGFVESGAYSELFADVVAVLDTNDPKVLVSSIDKDVKGRDFTTNIAVKGWNNRDEHHLLDPVRSFLWNRYLSKSGALRYRGDTLKILHEICARSFLNLAKMPVNSRPTIEQQNQNLISLLQPQLDRLFHNSYL